MNDRVVKIGPGGDTVLMMYNSTTPELDGPNGVAVDASGNVFVTTVDQQVVYKMNSSNSILVVYDPSDTWLSALVGPYAVKLDSSGNLYIVDNRAIPGRVVVMSSPSSPMNERSVPSTTLVYWCAMALIACHISAAYN